MSRRIDSWSKTRFVSFLLLCVANLNSVVSLPVQESGHIISGDKLNDEFHQKYNPSFAVDTFNPWNIYADYEMPINNDIPLLNKELSERSLKRSISYFYPLRGKKAEDDDQPETPIDKKASLSLYPMRGKKAKMMVLIPTRGKKESQESNYETALNVRSDQNALPDFHFSANAQDNIATGDNVDAGTKSAKDKEAKFGISQGSFHGTNGWKVEEEVERDAREEQIKRDFQDDVKMNQRAKRPIFPLTRSWRLFQKLRAPGIPPEGNKREALFFASRGKRSADNSAVVALALQPQY